MKENMSKKGGSRIFSAESILGVLMIKAIYHLPLRAFLRIFLLLIALLAFKAACCL
ncbi:hypothetical protein NEOC95_002389 [Neochlamydia sp. AcF95]|nr:hypothetical protein [Neochlamydia sp. AcF95]